MKEVILENKEEIHTVVGVYSKNKIYTKDGVLNNAIGRKSKISYYEGVICALMVYWVEQIGKWSIMNAIRLPDEIIRSEGIYIELPDEWV